MVVVSLIGGKMVNFLAGIILGGGAAIALAAYLWMGQQNQLVELYNESSDRYMEMYDVCTSKR